MKSNITILNVKSLLNSEKKTCKCQKENINIPQIIWVGGVNLLLNHIRQNRLFLVNLTGSNEPLCCSTNIMNNRTVSRGRYPR